MGNCICKRPFEEENKPDILLDEYSKAKSPTVLSNKQPTFINKVVTIEKVKEKEITDSIQKLSRNKEIGNSASDNLLKKNKVILKSMDSSMTEFTKEEKDFLFKTFRNIFAFEGLSDDDLNRIVNVMEKRKLSKGYKLIKNKADTLKCYFVYQGQLKFIQGDQTNFIYSGAIINELSLTNDVEISENMIAVSKVILFALNGEDFQDILKEQGKTKLFDFLELLESIPIIRDLIKRKFGSYRKTQTD